MYLVKELSNRALRLLQMIRLKNKLITHIIS